MIPLVVSVRESILSLPCHGIPDCSGYSCNFLRDRGGGPLSIEHLYGPSMPSTDASWNIGANQEGDCEYTQSILLITQGKQQP